MAYADFMREAIRIVDSRAKPYGDIEAGLNRTARLFEMMTGINLTNREAAMFLHCVKMSRIFEDPDNADHYLDGVNYLAFAGLSNETAQRDAKANQPSPTITPLPSSIKPLDLASRIGTTAVGSVTGPVASDLGA